MFFERVLHVHLHEISITFCKQMTSKVMVLIIHNESNSTSAQNYSEDKRTAVSEKSEMQPNTRVFARETTWHVLHCLETRASWSLLFFTIFIIWKQNLPLKWVHSLTICLPIAFTLNYVGQMFTFLNVKFLNQIVANLL